jgi:hypothetical protein
VSQSAESHRCHAEPFGKLRIDSVKHLAFSGWYEVEILRLPAQNDITAQYRRGGGNRARPGLDLGWGVEPLELLERLEPIN